MDIPKHHIHNRKRPKVSDVRPIYDLPMNPKHHVTAYTHLCCCPEPRVTFSQSTTYEFLQNALSSTILPIYSITEPNPTTAEWDWEWKVRNTKRTATAQIREIVGECLMITHVKLYLLIYLNDLLQLTEPWIFWSLQAPAYEQVSSYDTSERSKKFNRRITITGRLATL